MTQQYNHVELVINVTQFYALRSVLAKLSDQGAYRGMFRDYLSDLLQRSTEYATRITHRQTGRLASAHMWEYDTHAMTGRMYINRRLVYTSSPTSTVLRWPFIYGTYEHSRGGPHAFYQRTIDEYMMPRGLQGLRQKVEYTFR